MLLRFPFCSSSQNQQCLLELDCLQLTDIFESFIYIFFSRSRCPFQLQSHTLSSITNSARNLRVHSYRYAHTVWGPKHHHLRFFSWLQVWHPQGWESGASSWRSEQCGLSFSKNQAFFPKAEAPLGLSNFFLGYTSVSTWKCMCFSFLSNNCAPEARCV